MFAKLLKYEWKTGWRMIGALSLAVLGLGFLAVVLLRLIVFCGSHTASGLSGVILVVLSMALVFMAIALGVYAVGVQVWLLYRFYRHKFTDEGYLTFTLPVSVRQLFLSSYVNILLWTLISGAVISVTVFVALLFGPVKNGLVNVDVLIELWEVLKGIAAVFVQPENTVIFGAMALQMLVSLISAPVISMTCITVGAVLVKKHKILAAFGIYYGFSTLMGVVGTTFTFLATMMAPGNGQGLLLTGNGIQALLQLGTAVGGYFLSTYLMKYKLNLP